MARWHVLRWRPVLVVRGEQRAAMRKRACFNQSAKQGKGLPPALDQSASSPVHGLYALEMCRCLCKKVVLEQRVWRQRWNATASDCLLASLTRLRTCFSLARALTTICSIIWSLLWAFVWKAPLHDAADTCKSNQLSRHLYTHGHRHEHHHPQQRQEKQW